MLKAELLKPNTLSGNLGSANPLSGSFGNVNISSGATDHDALKGRDKPDQHPIGAITGLQEALDNAGMKFETDETLSLKDGVLSVNTAKEPDPDNTLPITSAAVAQTVGNIEILLSTI